MSIVFRQPDSFLNGALVKHLTNLLVEESLLEVAEQLNNINTEKVVKIDDEPIYVLNIGTRHFIYTCQSFREYDLEKLHIIANKIIEQCEQ